MKKVFYFFIALFLVSGVIEGDAAELSKQDLKEIKNDAKKNAKKYEKEGWLTLPGALPLVRQLEESYKMEKSKDYNGENEFILRVALAVGQSYDAAKMQAIQVAKTYIADALESEVAGIMENSVNNQILGEDEAASIEKTLTSSKSKIAQRLGRVVTVVEQYRRLQNKNYEVMVVLAYSERQAREIAKRVVMDSMENESKELKDRLNELVNW